MIESGPLESDTPLRPVNQADLKRVWELIQSSKDVARAPGIGVGIDSEMIAQQCQPGTDARAAFFRAALLEYLFQSGLLNDWRDGNEPANAVFQAAAIFPMEQGVQGFDPTAFVERLRSPDL